MFNLDHGVWERQTHQRVAVVEGLLRYANDRFWDRHQDVDQHSGIVNRSKDLHSKKVSDRIQITEFGIVKLSSKKAWDPMEATEFGIDKCLKEIQLQKARLPM